MIAEVIINSNVKNLNRTFDYNIPISMEKNIKIGSRVLVKFGNIKNLEEGFVVNIKDKSEFEVKDISVVEEKDFIDEPKIRLAKWMAHRYFCNISDCIKLMLPPGTGTKDVQKRVKEKSMNAVKLKKDKNEINNDIVIRKIKSDKQIKVLNFLMDNNDVLIKDLENFTETSQSIIKTLEKNGYVEIYEKKIERNPFIHKVIEKNTKLNLTDEQEHAYKMVENAIDDYMFSEFLLYGVTGSGKTEVYLQLIEKMIEQDKTSIMLVPEISLTPQTVDRFLARFGESNIAVLHSKLSVGERYDQWYKIKTGQAKVVIGARSAIFAPIENLGLIIIDEEHDSSYKSEMTPRYNVKDVAKYLGMEYNVPIVYGSATPDMTTYYRAINGEIDLLKLTKRANNSQLPNVEIIDLKQELLNGNRSMISNKLYKSIEENIINKKQTILFLNRRGYSTFIMCRDCGYTVKCKNCNITMTYHLNQNKLKCHYCGYETNNLVTCPECNSKNIRYFGTGTQKLENEINKMFPHATTIRMDVDTVTTKNSHETILNEFKEKNIDILIGTQMVVKGHHFPNVTLVGVIAADSNLNLDDYRASEKTFQILTQVAGRAGRGKDMGNVIIQTYNPDNFSIEFSKQQDYDLFYELESNLRKQLKYPPFCDIILLGFSSESELEIKKYATEVHQYLKNKIEKENIPIMLYKPIPAPIDKIKNKFRWRIIIKCKFGEDIIKILNDCNEFFIKKNNNVNMVIDVNPNNML
ncbi:MAG: primosomal protein N' [Clostridiales bacterium]|nr:primosomal protein N' [Clostridiales bacterium]